MGKLNIEIQESDFNRKSTSSYQLSILVGMDSLLYLVSDNNKKVLLLRDYQLNSSGDVNSKSRTIAELINSEPLFSRLFQKVKIACQTQEFTILPSRLFNDKEMDSYLKGVLEIPEDAIISVNNVSEVNASLIYSSLEEEHNLFKRKFTTGKEFHIGTALILGAQGLTNDQSDHYLFLNVRDHHLQIVLFEKRSLLLFNQFPFKTAKDAVYYLLLIFSQFKLNAEETPVWLSGKIVEDSELYTLFYRYIRKIQFVPSPGFLTFGKKIDTVPIHFYHDLFSLSLCK